MLLDDRRGDGHDRLEGASDIVGEHQADEQQSDDDQQRRGDLDQATLPGRLAEIVRGHQPHQQAVAPGGRGDREVVEPGHRPVQRLDALGGDRHAAQDAKQLSVLDGGGHQAAVPKDREPHRVLVPDLLERLPAEGHPDLDHPDGDAVPLLDRRRGDDLEPFVTHRHRGPGAPGPGGLDQGGCERPAAGWSETQ
jgi:hypothetical protein